MVQAGDRFEPSPQLDVSRATIDAVVDWMGTKCLYLLIQQNRNWAMTGEKCLKPMLLPIVLQLGAIMLELHKPALGS